VGEKRGGTSRAEGRLAAGSAEGAREIGSIAALQHDDDDKHEAHGDVERDQDGRGAPANSNQSDGDRQG